MLGKLEYSTCLDSKNIDSVIHHVSQPYQVLKCPEFVSIIRRLNDFLRWDQIKEVTERKGRRGRGYEGAGSQTTTHIALHKNGPNRGCHLWPGSLDFFLIRASAGCSVHRREVQGCHSSAALITAYKWENKSCPAKAIPCLTIFIKTDTHLGPFK